MTLVGLDEIVEYDLRIALVDVNHERGVDFVVVETRQNALETFIAEHAREHSRRRGRRVMNHSTVRIVNHHGRSVLDVGTAVQAVCHHDRWWQTVGCGGDRRGAGASHLTTGDDTDASIDSGMNVVFGSVDDGGLIERVQVEESGGQEDGESVGQVDVADARLAQIDHETVDGQESGEIVATHDRLVAVLALECV